MATFQQLQNRVKAWIIDGPTAVINEIPVLITSSIAWLEGKHNFQVMQNELQYVTTSTPALGLSQTHVIGQIPVQWKCQRDDNPYYVLYIGSVRELQWQPNRTMMYRQWNRQDVNQVGPPHDLLLGEATNSTIPDPNNPDLNMSALNIEVYPYPDGSSDWSDGNYRINIPYFGYLPALVNPTDANWFTLDGPQAEFCVSSAIWQAFMMMEDEGRASAHKVRAVGMKYDGSHDPDIGGWARSVIDMDKGILSMPGRYLAMRRDVFGPRDQWRQ
jgi:hypothetical protein